LKSNTYIIQTSVTPLFYLFATDTCLLTSPATKYSGMF
jgi:hypothetical protein